MTYKGTIRNGTVVLESAAELPEGAEVRVALAGEPTPPNPASRFEPLELEQPMSPSSEGTNAEPRAQKAGIWQALRSLPEDAGFEDAIEKVYLLYKIARGARQLDSGQGIPHEEVRRQFSEWLE